MPCATDVRTHGASPYAVQRHLLETLSPGLTELSQITQLASRLCRQQYDLRHCQTGLAACTVPPCTTTYLTNSIECPFTAITVAELKMMESNRHEDVAQAIASAAQQFPRDGQPQQHGESSKSFVTWYGGGGLMLRVRFSQELRQRCFWISTFSLLLALPWHFWKCNPQTPDDSQKRNDNRLQHLHTLRLRYHSDHEREDSTTGTAKSRRKPYTRDM